MTRALRSRRRDETPHYPRRASYARVVSVGDDLEAIAPDGCAVEVYSLLEAHEEPALLAAVFPPGSTILEMGAGTGRITRPLVAAGYDVTAIDEPRAMLDRFSDAGAEQVLSSIQALELGRRF